MTQSPEGRPSPRPLVKLMPGHDRRVKAGHPWAFSNEIAMTAAARALPPGTAVRLEGDDGVRHGTWSFNPHSLMAARRLDADPDVPLDVEWARRKLGVALALRERFFDTPYYRLVHAEADGLPGLVIDRYGDALALQANTAGMETLTPVLVEALVGLLNPRLIVARNDSSVRTVEGLAEETKQLWGTETTARVEEGGLGFAVDLLSGQKTGWFFDQRENRDRVARLAAGATVLDAFCHTGGFGLRCARAGAAKVTLLDRSAPALDLAMATAEGNGLADRVETRRAEALEALERMGAAGERFDIVIADPPAFAKTRKDHAVALRGYGKLARQAATLVAPGGFLLLASCSHHVGPGEFTDACIWGIGRASRGERAETGRGERAETGLGERAGLGRGERAGPGREAKLLFTGGAGPDHPVHPYLPESAYLKALLFQLA